MPNAGALAVLRSSPIFRGIAEELLAEVAVLCRNRVYRRGAAVFEEGTPGTKLYGVISGRLLITTTSEKGLELNLNVVEPGEIVGEIAFLDGGLRTATGRAAETSTCFEMDRVAFFKLLERSPQLSAHLLQLVCKRVRWMTKQAADSAFLSVPERLVVRLRDLAKPAREPDVAADAQAAEVKISQAELAQFLGISRQVVNGYLRAWEREGHVELGRGSIRIKDFAALS
jgi:CRP/FNR family transcriptional regulator, cyclic AMP receptor protein